MRELIRFAWITIPQRANGISPTCGAARKRNARPTTYMILNFNIFAASRSAPLYSNHSRNTLAPGPSGKSKMTQPIVIVRPAIIRAIEYGSIVATKLPSPKLLCHL